MTVKGNWCWMDAYHALIATLNIGCKWLEFHDPKMSAGWKPDTLNCHSWPHPDAHLCHYQNKETFASCQRQALMPLVMTTDIFFHRGVCSSVTGKWVPSFWRKMHYINCFSHFYLQGSRAAELVEEFLKSQSPGFVAYCTGVTCTEIKSRYLRSLWQSLNCILLCANSVTLSKFLTVAWHHAYLTELVFSTTSYG